MSSPNLPTSNILLFNENGTEVGATSKGQFHGLRIVGGGTFTDEGEGIAGLHIATSGLIIEDDGVELGFFSTIDFVNFTLDDLGGGVLSVTGPSQGGIEIETTDIDIVLTPTQAAFATQRFTGANTAGIDATYPSPATIAAGYSRFVINLTPDDIIVKTSAGATVTVATGTSVQLWFDETGVFLKSAAV